MPTLTIAEEEITDFQDTDTDATLRIYCTESFTDTDGLRHIKGGIGSKQFFKSVDCSITGGVITIPELEHPIPQNPYLNTRFFAYLYNQSGREITCLVANYLIIRDQTATTWEAVRIYNQSRIPYGTTGFLDRDQTQSLINENLNPIAASLENFYTKTASDEKFVNLNPYALSFDTAKYHHVYHGSFWKANQNYKNVFAEFKIKPRSSGYFISAGYTGAHVLLVGCAGDMVNGFPLTGNFYDANTGTPITFATIDALRYDEWAHVALAYDGANITCIINGVPSSVTAYTGQRRTNSSLEGTLLVGGSDHLNFTGEIAGVKIYECGTGALPYSNPHNTVVRPHFDDYFKQTTITNGSDDVGATFLADYSTKLLTDFGVGQSASKKNDGTLAETLSSAGMTGEIGAYNKPAALNRVAANLPQWVVDPFEYSTTGAEPLTPIATATAYDSFGRTDKHYGNSTTLGLGNLEVGNSLWSAWRTSTNYGILNGNVYPQNTTPGITWFDDGALNCEVRMYKPDNGFVTGNGIVYQMPFRIIDANNYNFLYVDEYGQGFVFQVVAGTNLGHLGSISFGATWGYCAVRLNGASVSVINSGLSLTTQTMTQNLTGTGKGMLLNHPLQRIKQFAVLP